jgi:hypothetical protein
MSTEPSLDPTEPISPEAVLVSPELREPALARARQFPTGVPRAASRQPAVTRVEAVAPATRPRRVRVLLLAAAGAAVTLAAAALLQAARDATRLVPLPRDGRGVGTSPPATTSPGTTVRPRFTGKRPRHARAATPTATSVGKLSPPATAQPKHEPTSAGPRMTVRAERNVLDSPRFFIRLGARGRRFVDPATRLFRSRVSVRCTPRPDATRLSCVVRRGGASLTFAYQRTSAHSFRLVQP